MDMRKYSGGIIKPEDLYDGLRRKGSSQFLKMKNTAAPCCTSKAATGLLLE
jgi:hypothetical protein